MADGDFTVKTLGRFTIPGGGFTTAGVAKNNKVIVWGEVTGTYNTGGFVFGATAVGLSRLDFLSAQALNINGSAQTAAAPFVGVYTATTSGTNGNLIFTDDGGTEATDSGTLVFTFLAIGDSAAPADLA